MIHFSKMTGAGNDFVAVDNRRSIIQDPAAFAKSVCDRRYGIGADGILLVESSDNAEFLMKYFNADGSYGGMCGNGGRCIAMFARQEGIISRDDFAFEALDYVYTGKITGDIVLLNMRDPAAIRYDDKVIVGDLQVVAHSIDTGAPHVVVFEGENPSLFYPSFEQMEIEQVGRSIRNAFQLYPLGTNVNFVKITGANAITIRTYERGVEAETLACGTGSIASAIVSAIRKGCSTPVNVLTRSKEKLKVAFDRIDGKVCNVNLEGGALRVFSGKIDFPNRSDLP